MKQSTFTKKYVKKNEWDANCTPLNPANDTFECNVTK
jgi:hypothetical protein